MSNKLFRALSMALCCVLLAQLCLPAVAAGEGDTVYLTSENDLYVFAERCAYDAWSEGKTVILQRDIALGGVDFSPIVSFGGTFEGGGHTISGLNVAANVSPAGLFGTVTGTVRELKVEGTVAPGGTADVVGGIAGVNRGTIADCTFTGTVSGQKRAGGVVGENMASGTLRRCVVDGGVFGKNMTGGVVGANHGTVSLCVNRAYVNTNTLDPSVSFDKLELNLTDGAQSLVSPDTYNVTVDSGGIAGYSDGALFGCRNSGSVGYRHTGYNVGGVAGRSSGHVASCANEGAVYGRREVGGVVGMAEPYLKIDLRESTLDEARRQLNALSGLINKTVSDAESASDAVSTRLTEIGRTVDEAESSAKTLTEQLTGYLDDSVREIDRGSEILDAVIPQLYDASNGLTDASATLTRALDSLEKTVEALDRSGASRELTAMARDLSDAADAFDAGVKEISYGLGRLGNIVGPASGVKESEWREGVFGENGALRQIQDGVGESAAALAALSAVLSTLREKLHSGEFTTLEQVYNYLTDCDLHGLLDAAEAGFQKSLSGIAYICDNTSLDPKAARDGLEAIRKGFDVLANGRNGQRSPMRCISSAFDHLAAAIQDATGAAGGLEDSILGFRDASSQAGGALEKADKLLDYLRHQERLNLETLGERTDETADALYASVRDISNNLDLLNREAKSSTDTVLDDVRRINSQFTALMDTLLDAVEEVENASASDLVEDTSDEDIDAVVNGKVLLCSNSGTVNGDIDVGGVAGAMMVYNELDPENDGETEQGAALRRRYELKCVLQDCVNTGAAEGKRDNVGAVCGSALLGVISGCEAYGSAAGEGDCVGGVAGFADNTIRACWSRCTLSGAQKVGGVVGSGRTERSNLSVENCRALVEVTGCEQYAGSILGVDTGRLSGNLFVSETLPGIDRVSERGRAEPVSYDQLLAEPGLPEAFRSFTLRFVADGKTVRETPFHYGDSFGDDAFPEIPAVEGQFARWDRTKLQDLRFDTTVTAVYLPCLTALGSGITRSASRPTFFVEGAFDDGGALLAAPAVFDFDDGQHDFLSRIRSYRRTLLEQWQLTLPRDGAPAHTVRYLPPEGVSDHLVLYTLENGVWTPLETGKMGSYLTFETAEDELSLAVVSTATPWWVWALVGGFVLAAIAMLAVLLIRKKPKRVLTDEEKRKEAKRKKRLRAVRIVLAALAIALGAAAGTILYLAPGLTDGVELYMLLHNYAERNDIDMELAVTAQVGGKSFDTDVDFFTAECEGKRVSCVLWQDVPLYYCDGAMLLENGRAYRTEGVLPDYTGILGHVASLYRAVEVTASERNGVKTYHAVAKDGAAERVLTTLLPSVVTSVPETEEVKLDLVLSDGEPEGLYITWSGEAGEARAELHPCAKTKDHTLPQAVRASIASGAAANAEPIAPEFKRLLLAWTELATRDPLGADVTLTANCGPLLLNESLTWQRTTYGDTTLSCISHRGARVYYTDDAACRANGLPLSAGGATFTDTEKLLHLAYEALLLGDVTITESRNGWHCDVSLDADAMAAFAEVIAPDAKKLGLAAQEGTIRLDASDDAVTAIAVQCKGAVRVAGAEVFASIGAKLAFQQDVTFYTPRQNVLEALGLSE